jgi:hypothetical protein
MARLSDYENITVDSPRAGSRGLPKGGGCGLWLFFVLLVAVICLAVAWFFSSRQPAGAPETQTAPSPEAGGAAAPETAPPPARQNHARPFTFTLKTTGVTRVLITQKNDGKVLLDDEVKPHLPLSLVGQGPLSVVSERASALRITVGGEAFALPADAGENANEFTVEPASD